jgi:NDP-sugar pyrophosphorylase family protein
MDIGTPQRYLRASWDILEGTVETELAGDGGPFIGEGVEIADGATIDARAVVRSGSRIEPGVVISESVLLDRCRIGADAEVRGSILAAEVVVGEGATIGAGSVIGEGARVEAGAIVEPESRVQPDELVEAEVPA